MRSSRSSTEILSELLAKATRNQNGCLISHLRPNAKGYVPVQVGGRNGEKWRAHRFVWAMKNGNPSPELKVCHRCDTRNCIEIEHLFLGTNADNSADMVQKNRVARLGRPAISFELLEEAFLLKQRGKSLREIAYIQGLSSPSAVADRLRRYHEGVANVIL